MLKPQFKTTLIFKITFFLPTNEVEGQVSVHHSIQGGTHVAITHDALGHWHPLPVEYWID